MKTVIPPHFLCIGTQKAGTTWLHRNLATHPDIWMPPVKEIMYFNRKSSSPLVIQFFQPRKMGLRDLVIRGIRRRLTMDTKQPFVSGMTSKRNTPLLKNKYGHENTKGEIIEWYMRFLFLPRSDAWYLSLYSPCKGRITGDITPYYANLGINSVARIHELVPQAKIIYILRNPIHRLWSQAGMHFSRYGYPGLSSVREQEVLQFLDNMIPHQLSDYLGNLRNWVSVYPEEQIYVGFFDRLSKEPAIFLKDIYRFLNVEASDRVIHKTVFERHNAGQINPISERFANHLASRFYP